MTSHVKTRTEAEEVAIGNGHELGPWTKTDWSHPNARCQHVGCIAYCFDAPEGVSLLNCSRACPVLAKTRIEAEKLAAEVGHRLYPWRQSSIGDGGHDIAYCQNPGCHLCLTAEPDGGTLRMGYGLGYDCPAPS